MKNYIFDNEDGYIKKCENEGCHNQIFIGVSRQFCRECLQEQGLELEDMDFKCIPHYVQWVAH